MKNLLIVVLLFLTGCASLPEGINTSSKCKYTVDGLECEREQVWHLRDGSGAIFNADHTSLWFESHEDCREFLRDKKNREYLDSSNTGRIRNCGANGRTGTSPDVSNYYVYTDGKEDGDFYYQITNLITINTDDPDPYSPKEGFIAMFTSKDALETFQDEFDYQTIVDTYSTRNVKRIKVKRMY